ncbi:hypothetical protein K3495_g237 [Podosphaera aphanis]|nr:hypothetical protein K3495_g237 [Podosphaera aphanis]
MYINTTTIKSTSVHPGTEEIFYPEIPESRRRSTILEE